MRLKQDHSDVTFAAFVSIRNFITAAIKGLWRRAGLGKEAQAVKKW